MSVCSVLVVLPVVLVGLFLIMLVVLVVVMMSVLVVIVFMFVFIFLIQRNINSNIISDHRLVLRWCFRDLMEAMRREALLCEARTGHFRSMRPLHMHMGYIILLLLVYFPGEGKWE